MDGDPKFRRFSWLDVWPGVARIWLAGQSAGLAIAAFAAFTLCTTLVNLLVWRDLLPWGPPLGFATTGAVWILGLLDARHLRQSVAKSDGGDPDQDLFLEARREYLTGNHDLAERLLIQRITGHPADMPPRLLLATLYRRLGRRDDARRQLRRMQRWRSAASWQMEIRREWEHLARSEFSGSDEMTGRTPRLADYLSSPQVEEAA